MSVGFYVINDIFKKKIKTSIFQFLITMVATVIFDLTVAIIIGILFSLVLFIIKVSEMQVNVADVDPAKLNQDKLSEKQRFTKVAYITGPLYFGTSNKVEEKLGELSDEHIIILSMRGVPFADVSGVSALQEFTQRLCDQDIEVYFTCVQPRVMEMFERCGLADEVGHENFFWSTDKALEYIAMN